MRDRRTWVAFISLIVALVVALTIPHEGQRLVVTQSFPATTCPSNPSQASTVATLPSSKIAVRLIAPKKSIKLTTASVYNYQIGSPLLIDSTPLTTISSSHTGSWNAEVLCAVGMPDEWFIGGSGSLTSQGYFDIVNSGLSDSMVDIYPYTSKAALPVTSVVIKANSEKQVGLDALAPGEDSVAFHVVTRSGRSTTFLFDQRKKGLSSLGGEFVEPTASPSSVVVIPGLINATAHSFNGLTNTLRLLVPGNVDANLHVVVHASDGSFAPSGLDQFHVSHGTVTDIPLSNIIAASPYSLVIQSDQPVLASVNSHTSSDLAWSTAALPISRLTMNLGANLGNAQPTFAFVSPSGSVSGVIQWKGVGGKSGTVTLAGSDVVVWRPKVTLTRVTITATGGAGSSNPSTSTYGALITIGGGISYLPLNQGAALESARTPVVDARVITHQ
jgi:Family of unknown function (DUF5719)